MDHLEEKRLARQTRILADHATAKSHPTYPGYHLPSPAHFLFDYWGAYIRDGYYHIFYDVCVSPEDNEHTIYGHARSRDLLHWEYLPMPIAPLDCELRMNDGFICENGQGEPIMLYTSVFEDGSPRVHVAAKGTPDLLHFTRIPEGDPFMTLENHGGPAFGGGWSDPWVFDFNGKTYMLMSKCVCIDGSGDPLPVYEATDDSMLHWKYRGNLMDHNGEVVNFFPLDGKWVLIYSPYNSIEYFVGDLDPETLRFTPQRHEILSYGYHSQSNPTDRGFYATCVFREENRNVLCGWISGFVDSEGWNGCMGIPRQLGLNEKLELLQQPIPETDELHGQCIYHCADTTVSGLNVDLTGNLLDIQLRYSGGDLDLTLMNGFTPAMILELSRHEFAVNGETYEKIPFTQEEKSIRILVDKSFAEIFLDDGRVCATRCFGTLEDMAALTLRSDSPIRIHQLDVWEMKKTNISYHPDLLR